MDYLIKMIIVLTTTCTNKCFETFQISNQTLYDGIVEHFFPKEFRKTKFDIKNYLCFLKNHTCCRCTKTCRYYGTCCIDAFFNNNITSVEEYVDIFSNMTTIRKHVKILPVVNIADNSVDFRVEKLPIVASCENKQSVYADLCSRYRSSIEVRVIADGFVYKNKYCALCHNFRAYTNAPLQLTGYNTFTEASSTKLTIPNGLFELSIRMQNGLEFEKEQQIDMFTFLSKMKKLTCSTEDITLCHHSYLALIRTTKNWYANPYCAKCNGETDLKHSVCPDDMYILHPNRLTPNMDVYRPKPHFRLLISFDDHGKSKSVLVKGNPICSGDQYFDVYSNQCKSKSRYIQGENTSREKNSFNQSQLSRQKYMDRPLSQPIESVEKTYRCIQRMGGIAINTNIKRKKLTYTQANQTDFSKKYINISLANKRFLEFQSKSNESIDWILVPYNIIPYTELYGFSLKHNFLHNKVCSHPEALSQKFEVTKDCNVNVTNTIYNITEDIIYWINISHGQITHNAARCKRFHLIPNCKIQTLSMSLTTITNNSAIFHISKQENVYTSEQYLPLQEGLGICNVNEKKGMKEYAWLKNYDCFEFFLSLTLLSISIIFELLFLMVNLIWKKIKKVPEKNLIAFCIALFVCDIIGLTLPLIKNNINEISCKIVAIILHFFSLALCTWPCIVVNDVWLILRSKYARYSLTYLYFRYSIIAWGIPLIVTLVCLTVDLSSNGSLIRYGDQNYCWISPTSARLTMYIVPMTFTNYGSFLLVLIIVILTKREKSRDQSLLAKNDKLKFHKMIIKLFLLSGTAELIGLVQIPNATKENEVVVNVIFRFLHNTLRSSRGIFTFMTFGSSIIIEKYKQQLRTSTPVFELYTKRNQEQNKPLASKPS